MHDAPVIPAAMCRHCKKRVANGRRGMCNTCNQTPEVNRLYPPAPGRPKPLVCVNCEKGKVNRPRGLCWTCYYSPGMIAKYPPTSKYARRGVGNFTGSQPLPEPTDAMPGTPEKVAVLAARAARGEQLHHPDDPRIDAKGRVPTAPTAGTLHVPCGMSPAVGVIIAAVANPKESSLASVAASERETPFVASPGYHKKPRRKAKVTR